MRRVSRMRLPTQLDRPQWFSQLTPAALSSSPENALCVIVVDFERIVGKGVLGRSDAVCESNVDGVRGARHYLAGQFHFGLFNGVEPSSFVSPKSFNRWRRVQTGAVVSSSISGGA